MHEGFVNYNAGTSAPRWSRAGSAPASCRRRFRRRRRRLDHGHPVGGGKEIISIGERCLLGANAGIGISLGDDCVVEAGCYVTAGTKVTIQDMDSKPKVIKAAELSGAATCSSGATRSPAPSRPTRGR